MRYCVSDGGSWRWVDSDLVEREKDIRGTV